MNNTTWVQVGVTKLDEADVITAPGNNAKVMFSVIRYLPSPDSLGGVQDIETPELLIPRITPLPPIQSAGIMNVSLTTNVATVTTMDAHKILPGETVEVTGVTPTMFNGQYIVVTTPTTSTLTYAKTHPSNIPEADSVAGKVATVNLPESEMDYPELDEDERTHDGLWVIADGGLLGT